ncbi:MAG: TolC family protein [Pseudomonadota bacterium]
MKAIITFIVLGMGCAANSQALPIDSLPVLRAVDLDRVTNRSIQLESDQYQRIAQWRVAADKFQSALVKKQIAKDEFDRISELYRKGISNENQFRQAELSWKLAKDEVEISAARLKKNEAEARMVQLLMLEEGSPQNDTRFEMAKMLKQKAQSNLEVLSSQLNSAQSSLAYFQRQYEITRELFEKGLRTKSQLESWQVQLQSQKDSLAALQHRVQSAEQEIKGAELVMDRLI